MSTYSRQSSSSFHGVSVSRLTASTSASVMRQSIFSRSSTPTSSANCRTISGSSVSRRKAASDIFRCCADQELDRRRARRRRDRGARTSARAMRALSTRDARRRATCRRRGTAAPAPAARARRARRAGARSARAPGAGFDEPLEVADRQQRVLVDGVLVVEVAHHAAADRLELGKHLPEQPGVVHLRQPRVEAGPRLEEAQQRVPVRGGRKEILGREAAGVLLDAGQRIVRHRASAVDRRLEQRRARFRAGRRPRGTSTNRMPSAERTRFGPIGAGAALSAQRSDRSMARAWRK